MSTEEQQNGEVTLDTLAAMIKTGFDEVHSKFDEMNDKIEAVDASLRVEIKATREEMRQGFAKINPILTAHKERITTLEHQVLP